MVEHLSKKQWIEVVAWINMRWTNANIDENKTHRLVNPCPVCESKPDCNCVKIPFIFKIFLKRVL